MKYIVTTRFAAIAQVKKFAMVDGTVPGWLAASGDDLHYDHHRPGGADIQILEMDTAPILRDTDGYTIVTTQIDADACVAAAWLQLNEDERQVNLRKLSAIAYDCDHLAVPSYLANLSSFAAQAVAAMKTGSSSLVKELDLPADRKGWSVLDKEEYASKAFEAGTQAILDACRGIAPWPGENGEASGYWQTVEKNVQMILDGDRVSLYKGCLIFDGKGLQGKYIDPRCWLRAAQAMGIRDDAPLQSRTLCPITLTQREVYIEDTFQGYSYTIGCIPFHPKLNELDFTSGTFDALTKAEKSINPHADGWGGRKTVGGSGWNTPSNLSPQEIIDIAVKCF